MTIPPEVEADCRRLVAIIDEQAARSFVGLPTDASVVDEVTKRLLAAGFPVTAFVREVMKRRFGLDPEAPTEQFYGLGIGELLKS